MTGWRSIARITAGEAGLRCYEADFRCINDHSPRRIVSTGKCVGCALAAKARRRARRSGSFARKRAREAGAITYIGKPCRKSGHDGLRYVSSATCMACARGTSTETWKSLWDRQRGICGICLKNIVREDVWEVDHRVALACDGVNDRSNLQIAHMKCNRSKGKRHEIDFAQERFGRLL